MLPSIDSLPVGVGQRVLDQAPALEHRDVRVAALQHVDAHQVAAGRPPLAGAAAAPFEHVVVERRPTASHRRRGRPARRRHDGAAGPVSAHRRPRRARCSPGWCRRCHRRHRAPGRGHRGDGDAWGRPALRSRRRSRPRRCHPRRCRVRPGASHRSGASGRDANRRCAAGGCG